MQYKDTSLKRKIIAKQKEKKNGESWNWRWNDGMKNIIQSSKIHESVTDQARRGVTPCLLKTIQEMVAEARLIFSWNKNG